MNNLKVFARLIFLFLSIPVLTLMFGVTLLILTFIVIIFFIEDIIYNRR